MGERNGYFHGIRVFWGIWGLFVCCSSFGNEQPSFKEESAPELAIALSQSVERELGDSLFAGQSPEQGMRGFRFHNTDHDARAHSQESPAIQLVMEGVGLLLPTYVLGVLQHEAAHASAVVLFGGKVQGLDVFPRDVNGQLRFGETHWSGTFDRTQKTFIHLAPKLVDFSILGSYVVALETGSYPENKHAQLALLMFATSAWVDFVKDFFTTHPGNEIVKTWDSYGVAREDERLPYRIVWGALATGAAFELGRGFVKLFSKKKEGRDLLFISQGSNAGLVAGPVYVGIVGQF